MENIRTVKAYDPQAALYPDEEEKPDKPVDRKAEERFRRVAMWFAQEVQAQGPNRWKMARAQNFVDGEQWTQEEKAELEERNQPALVYNLIGTTVRWITGTEKRTRVDYSVIGRGEEDTEGAENKTALLKYLSDVNRGGYYRSKAFYDAVTAGLGWIEVGVRGDQGEEPLFERWVDWREVWHDRLAKEPDCSDGRYVFKAKWIDLDTALVYFPEQAEALENAAEDHEFYYQDDEFAESAEEYSLTQAVGVSADMGDNKRRRVRIVECWYREAERCTVIKSSCPANKAIFNEEDPRLAALEDVEIFPAVRQVMRLMLFVSGRANNTGQMLYDGRSPYWHNRFPLVPVWGYRRSKDGLPYGVVDGLIDPQVDLNKRKSKSLYILSTNQVVMDKGAVDDIEVLAEEVSRPDGIIEKNVGKELNIIKDRTLADQHVQGMEQDAQYIQRVGGITDENLGRQTNATSGKAIEARQDQGTTVTADLFDNFRIAFQIAGELKLSLIEQYYDEEKILRILGENGKVEYKTINSNGAQSITERQADFVVDEQAFDKSARRHMAAMLFEMIAKMPPEVAIKLLDVVIEMSDVPMREELVARIRQINGMRDSKTEPTPEEMQAMEAQRQEAEAQKAKQDRLENANIALVEAKAKAEMDKSAAATIQAVLAKLTAMEKAMNVAGFLQQNPTIGQGADAVMADAA